MRTATLSSSRWLLLLALLLPAGQHCQAQAVLPADSLSQQFRRYNRHALTEQLFVHLDRPAYVAGESIWLKIYAVDGTHHRPLALSKVAYVELLDATQRPVGQAKIALSQAMGHGTLELPASLASGSYVVRAYTNWMRNAGPDFYFQTPVTVVNTWQGGPAVATAAPTYDLQFFPEGGQLVRGLPGRVGFKLTDQQGHSVAATGTVADARGTTVATFQTLKFGMGSFAFTPAETGAAYTATVRLPNGRTTTAQLPAVAGQGYALRVTDAGPGAASLTLTVQAQGQPGASVQLLAHTGQQVTVNATAALANGQATFPIAKQALLPGITHFTVFSNSQPVAERLYFQRPTRALTVRGQAGAATYGPRALARVQLTAAQPAALSLAVYRLDSLATQHPAADISSYLLLAADLKGFVEDAGYYFRDSSATAQLAADNLMLTQGWRRFRWEAVLRNATPAPAYQPELNGYVLQARVSDPARQQPASDAVAYLSLLGRHYQFANSRSRADGMVQFEMPQFYGLRKMVLQLNPLRDSTNQLELLSPFTVGGAASAPALLPLTAPLAASLTERHVQVQTQRAFPGLTRYQPVPGDTLAFYGRPDEHYRLDDYTRFPTLEEVLREYVPGVLVRKRKDGFHFLVVDRPHRTILQENPLTLLDGLPVFNINQLMAFDPKRIKQLDVVASRYFLGQQLYDGLVSCRTYQGDLGGFALNPHALIEEYEGLQVPREFYTPRYDSPAQQRSRLPDLRNLLYWNPDVRLAAGQPQALDFFTSDQAGRYLVVAQGLTAGGLLGGTSFTFEVKPAL